MDIFGYKCIANVQTHSRALTTHRELWGFVFTFPRDFVIFLIFMLFCYFYNFKIKFHSLAHFDFASFFTISLFVYDFDGVTS